MVESGFFGHSRIEGRPGGGADVRTGEKQFELRIPSQTDNLEMIRDFVSKVSAKVGFGEDDVDKIRIAVDEACTNVIKHAYEREEEDQWN